MPQHTPNQNHARKARRSSSFDDVGQPSKAPGQDEDGADLIGSSEVKRHPVDPTSEEQGISNRPVREEHAFPDSPVADADPGPDSVETTPKQQGGPRGGV
jgi:hypothetical protein